MDSRETNAIIWYFQKRNCSSDDQWISYRDIQIEIIEKAYQQGKCEIFLGDHCIDFKEFIQINFTDHPQRTPIKRQIISDRNENLREERFYSSLADLPSSSSSSSSYGRVRDWCPFLNTWLKSSSATKAILNVSSCIDSCIDGILKEAALYSHSYQIEAQWMVDQLKSCRTKSRHETSKTSIHLYTRESFLYHLLNRTLRNGDYSKLDTLGPLCYLIRDYSRQCDEYFGIVYRGIQLSSTDIQSYREAIGTWHTWPSYTSTSKNRDMAEFRGNTLFIIEIIKSKLTAKRAYDIAEFSQFPNEEEVLLPAGISFQVINVEKDSTDKYLIYIKL